VKRQHGLKFEAHAVSRLVEARASTSALCGEPHFSRLALSSWLLDTRQALIMDDERKKSSERRLEDRHAREMKAAVWVYSGQLTRSWPVTAAPRA